MTRGTMRSASQLGVAVIVLCAGCAAASLPMRYPGRPPVSMSATQAEQDQRDCVAAAGRATVERAWTYIGCMVSGGHTVGVAFHVQSQVTYLEVTQTQPHDAPAAASDLDGCRQSAYAAGRAQGGARDGIIDRMQVTFRTCLAPLGYGVQRQPELSSKPPAR